MLVANAPTCNDVPKAAAEGDRPGAPERQEKPSLLLTG